MAEELGDVLLRVAFHAVVAEEAGTFTYEDIEGAIVAKLIRRHPHAFVDVKVDSALQVVANWQAIKASEGKATASPAERMPRSLPALMRAFELGKKLGWEAGSRETLERAVGRLEGEAGLAELLLAVVDYARSQGVDPELALREAADARARLPEESQGG
jgi:XTP/dITP diphosphohydrolase